MGAKTHITLRVEGMTCDGCARHVTNALKGVAGVEEAQVPGWRSGQATVIAKSSVPNEDFLNAVREAGYRAILRERRPLEPERRAPATEGC